MREFYNKDLYNNKSSYSTSTRVVQWTFQYISLNNKCKASLDCITCWEYVHPHMLPAPLWMMHDIHRTFTHITVHLIYE